MFETALQTIYGVLPALGWCGGWGGGYFGGPGYGMMGWLGPFGFIGHGLIWIAFIALIVWAIVRLTRGRRAMPAESPLDVLKRRLAEGSIGADEFAKLRKTLEEKK